MKKLLLSTLFLFMSFASFCEQHNFTSTYWGCYKYTDNVSYDKHTYYNAINIIIDKDYIVIKSAEGDVVKFFEVKSIEVGETNYKGIYYYCNNNMLINVYVDREQLIIRTYQNGQIFWFYV
jgi:hypothetical protein